jgi:hypothetical protein
LLARRLFGGVLEICDFRHETIRRTMIFIKPYSDGKNGFVLVGMLLTMLMMSVMALSMNRSAGMQT